MGRLLRTRRRREQNATTIVVKKEFLNVMILNLNCHTFRSAMSAGVSERVGAIAFLLTPAEPFSSGELFACFPPHKECEMSASPISADQAKEMLDRGDPIVWVDARNPVAWGGRRTSCRVRSECRSMKSTRIWARSRAMLRPSPIALDRTKHQAPVWRNC